MESQVTLHGYVDQHSGWGNLFHQVFSILVRRGVDVLVKPLAPPPTETLCIVRERLAPGNAHPFSIVVGPSNNRASKPYWLITNGNRPGEIQVFGGPHSEPRDGTLRSTDIQTALPDGLLLPRYDRKRGKAYVIGVGNTKAFLDPVLKWFQTALHGEPVCLAVKPFPVGSNPGVPHDRRINFERPQKLDWPEKEKWYHSLDCYVTHGLGIGFSALEAQACGVPVVRLRHVTEDDIVAGLRGLYIKQPKWKPAPATEGQTLEEALFV